MVQLDGADVTRWMSKATAEELALLIDSEYSDDEDVWIVRGVGPSGISVSSEGKPQPFLRPLSFFLQGTFFLGDRHGNQVAVLINGTRSVAEIRIDEANAHLRGVGFAVSQLGGDTVALFLSDAIRSCEMHGVAPDNEQWARIHDILSDGSTGNMRSGVKFVAKWIEHSENQRPGRYDYYRRVLLAFLYRHTGQLDKALQASDVVERPHEHEMSIAVLCTTRAAALMDMAELKPNDRDELLRRARLTLNKANAMSGGDSPDIRNAYVRLKKLDK